MSGDVTNLARVRERVEAAALANGRSAVDVRLLLAVKTVDATRIRALLEASGHTLIGQNRAQELTATEPELAGVPHETHFIGHLQSNKVNAVMRWVDCVQSVHSARLAERLDRAAAARGRDLEVFVQVNTSGEPTKAGADPDEAGDLAAAVGALEHLRLRGFMTIGANSPDPGRVRGSYEDLAKVRDAVVGAGAPGTADARELSMGMSGDLEVAIAAGASMVRVGSGVFGARD
ncbi:YggS family pyridoxal phosphate-dependent enzyme [Occultella glacieicola]|uniref:Pyridoxal phosphate homeostasis protein n=1 Tax=Occultella glacieicola TaxID=2518684 RepID=A0ABY2E725_9MICO|nr:YggS family pyridoxal phosphate-dependent enzyme [Occultella glacieicola]TDE95863.1 YggS family pyridoxal phosphate-dependent enzyme [Occultella glacieicola]